MKLSLSNIIFWPLVVIGLALAVTEFVPSLWYIVNKFKHLAEYQYLFYGMTAYFVIRRFKFFLKNEKWLQTFTHEFSHTIVSILFLQKIYSFRATETNGEIYRGGNHSFGDMFIGLAPYCFPYFTFLILIFRLLGEAQYLFIFDILVGFTYAFHLWCYKAETGNWQTDIQRQGLVKSYLYIAFFRLFSATIIILSIRFGSWGAVTTLFTEYKDDLVAWWGMLFG